MLKAPQDLLRDGLFWRHQTDGLAIFLSPKMFRVFRLPIAFQELVVVADRFHLQPLLSLFSGDGRFYILALSQNEIRVLEGERHRVSELDLKKVPVSLAEALQPDFTKAQLQFHTGTSGGQGGRAAIFHGHGVGEEDNKTSILRYFQLVDKGLRELLREGKTPLLLAGVEYLFSIYREANTYPYLVEKGIPGNPEALRAGDLHKEAWKIIGPYFQMEKEEAAAQFKQAAGTGKASNDFQDIIPAAYDGRVASLFVSLGRQQWGRFDPGRRTLDLRPQPMPGDEDLLDFAAIHTFLSGGSVYAVSPEKMPGSGLLAAVFRY